ncbi:hypothetical protein [Oryza sativa Japonica Group]|uniref:Uncharacterized protein n=1 Tax=Oryza sativa subsp. japonica TaxID=39947 RepID=Q5ZD11_ORYSJ|nr:hypothetical protein [Oryza sativa Japonica Group]
MAEQGDRHVVLKIECGGGHRQALLTMRLVPIAKGVLGFRGEEYTRRHNPAA